MSGTRGMTASAGASPATDSEFLRERLAAVAALPAEQRSADEAGFLRGHQLLAEVQTSLVVLQGEPSHAERCQHTAVAALALLGGLEELCALGVPLQVLLHVNSAALVALGPGQHSTALCGPERAGDSFARVALQFCDFVLVLSQFWLEAQMLDESLAAQRGSRAAYPDPAGELRRLQTMLFHEVFGMSVQCCIALVQCGVPRLALPSMDQLRRLWALLAFEWSSRLVWGMGRPSWMAGFPVPTPAEAQQLRSEAVAAMRQLCPSHPLTARLVAQAGLAAGGSAESILRQGLEHAAAAGGPHGASLLTAEYCYGLISTCSPTANTPPWGCLSLAEAAQLLQRGDAALARSKALLPPAYLTGAKHLRDLAPVRWQRAAVERHQQAGASEWREPLLAAGAAPDASQAFGVLRVERPICAGCGAGAIELRGCSGCKLPDVKYCSKECQAKHWPQHRSRCKAARAARAAAAQQGPAPPHAGAGAGAR